ncbi:MAG: hypothetical protein ACI9R3_005489 [Verrucomicrobiales bacterium]|jgi:hypothetical protein
MCENQRFKKSAISERWAPVGELAYRSRILEHADFQPCENRTEAADSSFLENECVVAILPSARVLQFYPDLLLPNLIGSQRLIFAMKMIVKDFNPIGVVSWQQ